MAGLYRYGDWTIGRNEDSNPGYYWSIHHPDRGEFYAHTLKEAKAAALRADREWQHSVEG
jgi:hypothetical protein